MKRRQYLYMVWAESPCHTTHSGYFFTAFEARVEAARLRKIYPKRYKITIEKILKKDY